MARGGRGSRGAGTGPGRGAGRGLKRAADADLNEESPKKLPARQKFRTAWLKDDRFKDWVLEVKEDPYKAKCLYCDTLMEAKCDTLVKHCGPKAIKHHENGQPFSTKRSKNQTTIEFPSLKPSLETSRAEARLTLFIVCHCAMMAVDHLTDLCKCVFPGKASSAMRCHRTKCTGLATNILAPHFKTDLREDIGDSPYSLIVDESTSTSVLKKLGVCILYYSKSMKQFVVTYLALHQLDAGNAAAIVKAIKEVLVAYNLDPMKMQGIGTDNATVMTGVHNGVHAKLKEEIPHLILIRCVCHSVQLAVSAAVKVSLPTGLEYLVAETYNWFSKSSGRQLSYARLYNLLNNGADPLKIVRACKTRWLSVEVAVTRILEQWNELKLHFSMAQGTESCFKAQTLHEMYSNPLNKLYLEFLLPVLTKCQEVNKNFQSNEADRSKLLNDLLLLVSSLARRAVTTAFRGDLLTVNVKNYLNPNVNRIVGEDIMAALSEIRISHPHIAEVDFETFVFNAKQFIITLVTELQSRLPDNLKVLQTISRLSPKNCLTPFKSPIAPLAELLQFSAQDIKKIKDQWDNLHLTQWNKDKISGTADLFWSEVFEYTDAVGANPFKELCTLAMRLLVLPWSNAEVERLFSAMNIVHTDLRNRMGNILCDAILAIRASLRRKGTCCNKYEFPESVLKKVGTMAAYQKEDAPAVPDYHDPYEMIPEELLDDPDDPPVMHNA